MPWADLVRAPGIIDLKNSHEFVMFRRRRTLP